MRLVPILSKSFAPNANVSTTLLQYDLGATTTATLDRAAVPVWMVPPLERLFRTSF